LLFDVALQPNATGELKTKPTQNAVRQLRELGLSADFVSTFALIFISRNVSVLILPLGDFV